MLFMLLWRAILRSKYRRIVRTHLPAIFAGQDIKLLERNVDDTERALNGGVLHYHQDRTDAVKQDVKVSIDKRQCRLLVDSKGQLSVDRMTNYGKR